MGDPGAATVAVSDNDVPVDFVLSVPATVAEDAVTVTVTVTATTAEDAPPATSVAVFLQRGAGSTATSGSDYGAVSESVFIGPSEFTAVTVGGQPRYRAVWTYDVTIVDDAEVEGDETLVLEMSRQATLPAIHTLGGGVGPVRATLTIVDDDTAPALPEVTIAADHAAFTAALDDVTFTLTRTEDPAAALDVAVALTQDRTLLASADLAQTVTFGAGEATATLIIQNHKFASHTVTEEEATLTATVQDGTGYEPGSPATVSTRIVVADPAVTASFEQAAYTFDEAGGDATVAVILRTATGVPSPNRQIFFSISTQAISGQAEAGNDYVHQSEFLSVSPSDFTPDGADFTARKEVTLVIVDDAIHEPDETLNMLLEPGPSTSGLVAFRQPDGTACPGSGCEATVTIVDNDASEDATLSGLAVNDGSTDLLTFAPGTTTYTAMVANDVETLTFSATKGDDGASVAYLDVDGNAIDDADTAAGHQVPLDVGANVITVRVTAEDGTTQDYTVTVTRAVLAVSAVFGAARYDVTEGESVTVTVNLSEAPGRELTLPLERTNYGDGVNEVNDADLTGVPPSVTFAATAMSASFTVMATDNAVYNGENPRYVSLYPFPRPDGVFEGMTGATTTFVHILDNEDPPPTVTVAAAAGGETVTEGADAAFTLSRTGAATAELSVAVDVSETGAVLKDASVSPSSVTFDAGAATSTLALATDDDDTDNDAGTVTVTLGTGTGYAVGDPGAATVAVSDNDVPVDFVLSVPATVAEDAVTVTVTVTATTVEDAPPATSVAVFLQRGAGSTATSGSDYGAVSESVFIGPADFTAVTVGGQPRYRAVWTYDVTIVDDAEVEGDETLVLEMSRQATLPAIHTLAGGVGPVQATLTIVDDDKANVAPAFTSSETFGVDENGTAVGTVEASDDDTGDEITGYVLSGGADQALFSIGSTSGALTFQTAPNYEDPQDADTDNAYEVTVQATGGTEGRVLTETQTITVTVRDVDEQPDTPAKPTVTAVSGATDSLAVSWSEPDLNGGPAITGYGAEYRVGASGTWMDWTHMGTATTTTITGLTANTEHQVQVRALNGETPSDWSDPSDAVRTTAEMTPVVTITKDQGTVIEDAGAAGFTLSRTGSTTAALTVTVEVTQQADRDLLPDGAAAERTVTFAVGSATAALSVTLENDDLLETSGTLTVEVQAGSGYTVGDPASATVTVIDTDTGQPTPANLRALPGAGVGEVVLSWDAHALQLSFSGHQYRYKTDGDYLDAWTDIPNSGQYESLAGDGSNLTGYTVPGLVGGQLHTFQVRTYHAGTFSAASNDAMATPRSAAVSFGAGSYSVDEGGTVDVTVQLDAAPGREVVVPVSAAGAGGATAPGETGADWSGVPQNVTFGATDTAMTFTLAATQDLVDDDGESVALSFGTLPDGVTAGSPSQATVTITDDDAAAGACTLDTDDIWCGVVTVASTTNPVGVGFAVTEGALTDNSGDQTITIGSGSYTVTVVAILGTSPGPGALAILLDPIFPSTDEAILEFNTGGRTFKVSEATKTPSGNGYYWTNSGLSWSAGGEVTLRLRQAGATNNAPAFTSSETFGVDENGTTVGTVEASDSDTGDEITGYVLSGGADQALFAIGSTSGVLTFQAAPNYEDPQDADTDNAYEVTVQATGGTEGRVLTAIQTITVTVMDVDEQPATPAKPTLAAVSGATDSLAVSWSEPDLNGGPAITGYGVEYRVGASGTWTDWSHSGTDAMATITGLTANTDYQVQVRALNGETPSAFSDPSDAVRTTAEMTPVVTIAADKSLVFEEEGAAGFTLSRTGATSTALTVTVEVTQQADRDILPDGAASERTVTFAVGSATAALMVALDNDDLDETDSELTVKVQAGAGYTVGDPGSATVTVFDGDTGRPMPVNLTASPGAGVGEVVLSWDAHAPDLSFRSHQYRYKTDGDYLDAWTDIPNSGQWNTLEGDGSNLTGYTVTGLVGGQVHTFQVRTYTSSSSASDPSDEAMATPRSAVVSFGAGSYSVDEGGTVDVTVQLDAAPGREVVVPVSAAGAGGATPPGETGADWSGVPENVTFGATDTAMTFTLAATQDTVDDDGESVALSFGTLPDGVTAGSPSEATVTIVDDDAAALPTLSVEDASAAEGSGVTFTVTLSAAATADVTAIWTASIESGDTAESADFTAASTTLTFIPGETAKTVTVQTTDDTTDEDNETFTLTLSTPSSNATLAADPTATGTINDDDDPPTISVQDQTVNEGNQDPDGLLDVSGFPFRVTLSEVSEKRVRYRVRRVELASDTATDAELKEGAIYRGVHAFSAGNTDDVAEADVILDDALDEPDETFTLEIYDFENATAGNTRVTITIEDDDDPPSVSVADAEAAEGDAVEFAVTLSAPSGKTVTVDWEADTLDLEGDTALAGTDFTAASTTLTFMPSETAKTVTVQTTEDTTDEPDETFTLTLSSPSNVTLGDATATGTIVDDDDPPTLSVADASAAEGSAVTFTVTLSAAATADVTATWTASIESGDTAESADFTDLSAATGMVTVTKGQTAATFTVATAPDTTDEDDETFTLTLSTPSSNATLAADPTATGTITDDDALPTLIIADASGPEDSNEVEFTVTLSAVSGKTVTVGWGTFLNSGQTAEEEDFTSFPQTGSVTFSPGQTRAQLQVAVVDDELVESDETFEVTLGSARNATLEDNSATGTIVDNDVAPNAAPAFTSSATFGAEGERHRGGHGGGAGQRRGRHRDGLRDHRRRGYGVLLDRGDVGGAGVQDGAELRGRAGRGQRQHLRGDGAGDQRHGGPGEDGGPGDHGDGDRRRRRGAGRTECAVGVGGVGDEPERDLAGAGTTRARRSRTTTTAIGRPCRRARGWRWPTRRSRR